MSENRGNSSTRGGRKRSRAARSNDEGEYPDESKDPLLVPPAQRSAQHLRINDLSRMLQRNQQETIATHARAQQLLSGSLVAPVALGRPTAQEPTLRNRQHAADSLAVVPAFNPLVFQILRLQQLRASATVPRHSIQDQLGRHLQPNFRGQLNRQQQDNLQELLNRQQHPAPALLQALSLQNQLLAQRQMIAPSPIQLAGQGGSLNSNASAALALYQQRQQQQQPNLPSSSLDTISSHILGTYTRMQQEVAFQGGNQQRVQPSATVPTSEPARLAGRAPFLVARSEDEGRLTPYQCLARQHIQYFEAKQVQVEEGAQGRNKPIVLGQVGIRCIHCAVLARKDKAPAAAFYPSKLSGIYQSAQNIMNSHLAKDCGKVPKSVRERLLSMSNRKSPPGTGKAYWSEEAVKVGIYEDEHGLRFRPITASSNEATASSSPTVGAE